MEVESVMVTGANRGIGLELVKQLVQLPKPPKYVFATFRDDSTVQDLKNIKDSSKESQVILVKIDITKIEDIQNARKIIEDSVGEKGLNLLINNAGAVKWQGFPDITEDNMLFHFSTNTIGPLMIVKEMLPLLQKSAANKTDGLSVSRSAILNISSIAGSMATLSPASPLGTNIMGYRVSKAALNMTMKVVALTMTQESGILLVNMCPGWVKTDMGTDRAMLEVWDSVSDIIKTLPTLNESHHGTFLDRHGKTIPY
ncbi:C-factor-like [Argiope bruennichi]|uniref:C-factor-like n=1 Tax=Argiope bruennichi TaxID=94029 RepID=UPI0024948EDA|nr:C-factor-like [Argiope bruennichi]